MEPAFRGPGQAFAFGGLLFALLIAPVVVERAGWLDPADMLPSMPTYTGPVSHLQRQLFEETEPLDIAFVGSSFMWSAIDAPYVQDELSRALGRPARVATIASVWPGLDRDYALLRALLERRDVGMVVLQFPSRRLPTDDPAIEVNTVSDKPHVQAFRLFRADDLADVADGMALHHTAALYAGTVLGLPRHLLTLARPNQLTGSEVEETLGARFEEHGYYGAAWSPFTPPSPTIPVAEQIRSDATEGSFSFHDEPPPAYQMHFARRIAELLSEHRVPAVVMHIPMANELDAEVIQERVDWIEATGIEASMIGVPPARLFDGFSRDEALKFFVSDHLNANGTVFFTRTVTPALVQDFLSR